VEYQHITTKEIKLYTKIKQASPHISYPPIGSAMLGSEWKLIIPTAVPSLDIYTEKAVELAPVDYTQTWEIVPMTQLEIDTALTTYKAKKLLELDRDIKDNERFLVSVPLVDTSTIEMFGGRNDLYDIRERYDLMVENSIPSIYLRDTSNTMQFLGHLDVRRCYKAINMHRDSAIVYQWNKEKEINDCNTATELSAVTWTIN